MAEIIEVSRHADALPRWATTDGMTYTDSVTGATIERGPTDARRWIVTKYATGGISRGVGFPLRDHAEEHALGLRDAPGML